MLYDKKWDEKLPVDTFKSAAELNISVQEYEALKKVLHMFEAGEVADYDYKYRVKDQPHKKVLDMGTPAVETECGTVCCIGGWAATFMGIDGNEYVWGCQAETHPLRPLYWSNTCRSTTVKQATFALRSFLTTGRPNWEEAFTFHQ